MDPVVAFAIASALHAGFQLTVTTLVYPALAAQSADAWEAAHRRHSRHITPVVALVYGALLVTGVALVAHGPGATGWLGLAGAAAALAVTAAGAAPLHGRLGSRDDRLVGRLLTVDRWRCAFAVAGAAAAIASVAISG